MVNSIFKYLPILILFFSCARDLKKQSGGSYNVLYIFADDSVRHKCENIVNEIFSRTIFTPEEERIYSVEWANFDSLRAYTEKRNLVFFADFNVDGKVSRWVIESLEPAARKSVLENKEWIFVKHDLFAKDQLVLFLVSANSSLLASNLLINANFLYSLVDSFVNERVARFIFSSGFGEKEKFKLERELERRWGFKLRVPKFYDLEKSDSNFVWLRALKPERWVFVYFENSNDSSLSFDYWLDRRNFVGKTYYEGDIILDSTVKVEKTTFNGSPALRFSGLWFNPDEFIGGPFFSYLFFDKNANRKYIVDGALFAPIIRKEPYLRHLEIIAKSFSTK